MGLLLIGVLLCGLWFPATAQVYEQEMPADWQDKDVLRITAFAVGEGDALLLQCGGESMMVDGGPKPFRDPMKAAMEQRGIRHFKYLLNTHSHDDHIDGFQFVNEYAPISKFLITFPEDFNARMKSAVKFMKANNIPIEQIGNGDTFTLGEDGGVKMTVIQYHKSSWGVNDQSAMLMVQYGDRRMLFAGDNENRSQQYFAANPPEIGLNADIFKYPHHG